jgi:hypothetical protein
MARFEPGQSGNYNGRPKGKTGKWSDKKLAEEFSKGCETAMKTIKELMSDNTQNGATRLRAAIAWLSHDKQMRDFLYKQIQDELNKKDPKPEDNKLKQSKPAAVLSFKAVD